MSRRRVGCFAVCLFRLASVLLVVDEDRVCCLTHMILVMMEMDGLVVFTDRDVCIDTCSTQA